MAKFIVRSYVAVELVIEAEDRDAAEDLAGIKIQTMLADADIDFVEDAVVYDEQGEEVAE